MFPHEKREIVALDCCGISVAGKPGEIASVCPRVTDLDLTDNHIKDWKEVSMILNELKFLHFLNLCGNHLNDSTYSPNGVHSSAFQSGCFAALSKLVLNNTKVSLCTVQRFLKSLPSLIELHLSLNDYSSVPECDKCCTTVKRLHFNGNKIQHWNEVEKLGKMFPYLETLIIMENPLSNVERSCQDVSFLDLKCLSLTKTKLDSWEHIEALRKFENLNQVKLMGIPLLAKYEQDESRKLLVARLPNIKCLNGTPVTSIERENAERHFIRQHQTSDQPPTRYHELVSIHGELGPLADVNMDQTGEYVDVLMHVTGKPACLQTISLYKTAWKFRKDMAEMLQVHVSKISLYYKNNSLNLGCEKMIYKNRTLSRYGIKDGDEIFVDVYDN
ncbi:tubulin-specific chaperone cofactor E-like protein isoform X2 [Dendronephthya gigantea]|nr:tubulin-specific chaperone cofactor E-like protein isoform X2 [Dendronephthya gigantea]